MDGVTAAIPELDGINDRMTDATDNITTQKRRLLFHVHTFNSFDSWMTPEAIVAFARDNMIDMVVVSDHDDQRGARLCAELAGSDGPAFPIAAEYKSTQGDMISMFVTEPITTRDPYGIIEETHAQGGLVALPHPYKFSHFDDAIFELADVIEVFNARTSDKRNARAEVTATRLNKPTIAGVDAHLQRELGLVINEYDAPPDWDWRRVLLEAPRSAILEKTTLRNIRASAMISAIKRRRPKRLVKNIVRWILASSVATP